MEESEVKQPGLVYGSNSICTARSAPVLTVSECETGIGVCLCLVLSFFFDTESHVAQGGLALLSPPLEQTPR